ncbi:hypothetical protein NEOKW01_0990 [Nematocida sp. AWRm80]|nr:hypothetical protein NEOKW01_0990 [Nematocida sp. AWRm80]
MIVKQLNILVILFLIGTVISSSESGISVISTDSVNNNAPNPVNNNLIQPNPVDNNPVYPFIQNPNVYHTVAPHIKDAYLDTIDIIQGISSNIGIRVYRVNSINTLFMADINPLEPIRYVFEYNMYSSLFNDLHYDKWEWVNIPANKDEISLVNLELDITRLAKVKSTSENSLMTYFLYINILRELLKYNIGTLTIKTDIRLQNNTGNMDNTSTVFESISIKMINDFIDYKNLERTKLTEKPLNDTENNIAGIYNDSAIKNPVDIRISKLNIRSVPCDLLVPLMVIFKSVAPHIEIDVYNCPNYYQYHNTIPELYDIFHHARSHMVYHDH